MGNRVNRTTHPNHKKKTELSKSKKLVWSDGMTGNRFMLEKPAGVERHNVKKCKRDEAGQLILISVLKGSLASTPRSPSSARVDKEPSSNLSSNQTLASAPSNMKERLPKHGKLRKKSPRSKTWSSRSKGDENGLRVCRFLLCFDPPALTVEWERDPRCNADKASSSSKTHGGKSQTHIQFSVNDLVDLRSLAARVVREQPGLCERHLRCVEVLLRQLALRALPVYQVIVPEGAVLCSDHPNGMEKNFHLPQGALALITERVRQPDGWWIRIWSGQWLQAECTQPGYEEIVAERCEPSLDKVNQWLQDATFSGKAVLVENATMVAKQSGLDLEEVVS